MHKKFYLKWKIGCFLLLFGVTFSSRLHAQTYANSQANGVTGLCLLCGVSNPNNPVNGSSLSDYSTFNITAGLVGVTVYQTLIFPSASTSCDSLIIGIGSGNAILSANLFGGVTIQTYNGSTSNNDARVADSNIVHLIQSNTMAQIVIHPSATFDRVKLTLSSSLLGLLNSFRIYYAYINAGVPAAPSYTVPSGIDCGTSTLTINNYAAGTKYSVKEVYSDFFGNPFYDTSYTTTGSSIAVPLAYDTLPVTKDIYIQAIDTLTGCRSDSVHETFIEGGYGAIPAVDADTLSTCYGDSVTFHAYLPGYVTTVILWYDAPSGGNLVHTGNYFTVSPDSNTHYYVTTNNNCTYPLRKQVYVSVTKLPAPVYSVPEGYTCSDLASVIQNPQPGVSYIVEAVYKDSHGNPVLDTSFTIVNSDTIKLKNPLAFLEIVVQLSVQAIDSATGCRSDTVMSEFIFGSFGQYPAVDADSVSICASDSAVLHAYEPNGSLVPEMLWYSAASGGTLLYTGRYDTVRPSATTTYYVTSKLNCEYPVRHPVTVVVQSCPSNRPDLLSDSAARFGSTDRAAFSMFPNPTSGLVSVNSKYDLSGAWILVKDMQGREVQRVALSGSSFTLNVGNGLYVVSVITAKGDLLPGVLLLKK